MKALLDGPELESRETEDVEGTDVEAMADADAAGIALENVSRDLDADLAKLDRVDATLNAQQAVSPRALATSAIPRATRSSASCRRSRCDSPLSRRKRRPSKRLASTLPKPHSQQR
jgi:hypothetical protein